MNNSLAFLREMYKKKKKWASNGNCDRGFLTHTAWQPISTWFVNARAGDERAYFQKNKNPSRQTKHNKIITVDREERHTFTIFIYCYELDNSYNCWKSGRTRSQPLHAAWTKSKDNIYESSSTQRIKMKWKRGRKKNIDVWAARLIRFCHTFTFTTTQKVAPQKTNMRELYFIFLLQWKWKILNLKREAMAGGSESKLFAFIFAVELVAHTSNIRYIVSYISMAAHRARGFLFFAIHYWNQQKFVQNQQ